MNIDALEIRVKKAVSVLYQERFPTKGVEVSVPDFDARMERLRAVQRRMRSHRDLMGSRVRRASHVAAQLKKLSEMAGLLKAGKRIMSLDVERTMSDVLQEVGVTTFKRGEGFRSFNFRIEGAPRRSMRFAFGDSEVMPLAALSERLIAEANQSSAYVGHSIGYDFDTLWDNGVMMPRLTFMDTFYASCLMEGQDGKKLGELCAYMGVEAARPHGGGNDARYTMELVLAMIEAYA